MGVKFSARPSYIGSWYQAKVDGTARAAARTTQQLIVMGESSMRFNTDRILTGAMINAISSRMLDVNEDGASGEFGFINQFEDYFKYQTVTGFTHNRSSKYIEPTFALRDSFAEVVNAAPGVFSSNMGGV